MDTSTAVSASIVSQPRTPNRPPLMLRGFNAGVHWVSGIVLIYAFIRNGETSDAMLNPVAMRGEVRLGIVVGLLFLLRFAWVCNRRSRDGRWIGPSAPLPRSVLRRSTDWGIYLGVAATVASGLLIAYLRPGALILPGTRRRGFPTNNALLNTAVAFHVHVSTVLQWLCAFHAAYALWFWLVKRSRWGKIADGWLDRVATAAGRAGFPQLIASLLQP